jgi:hypothetical protein
MASLPVCLRSIGHVTLVGIALLGGLNLAGCKSTATTQNPGSVKAIEYPRLNPDTTLSYATEDVPVSYIEPVPSSAGRSDSYFETGQSGTKGKKNPFLMPGEKQLAQTQPLTQGGLSGNPSFTPEGLGVVFGTYWAKAGAAEGCKTSSIVALDGSYGQTNDYLPLRTPLSWSAPSAVLPDGRILIEGPEDPAASCPELKWQPDRWPLPPDQELYTLRPNTDSLLPLIQSEGFDGMAAVSPDGRYLVFASARTGDLDLYRLDLQTGESRRLTDKPGFDGQPCFTPDGKQIVWVVERPSGNRLGQYQQELEQGIYTPTETQIYVMNIDGGAQRRVLNLPGVNCQPTVHPLSQQIIFASNHHLLNLGGKIFNLFSMSPTGTQLRQITYGDQFDGAPNFAPDGSRMVFVSRRGNVPMGDYNLFITNWVE